MLRLGAVSRGKMERSRFFVKEDLMQGVKKTLVNHAATKQTAEKAKAEA